MPVRSSGLVGYGRLWAAAVFSLTAGAAAQAAQPGAKGAFPPFDPTFFASNLFWLAISFGLLYWLMSTIALPRIGSVLKDRSDKIAGDLNEAAAMQAKAEATAQAYEKALGEARQNAQAIAQKAREASAKASDDRRKTVEADLAAKLDEAERQITATKTSAMSNVKALGSDVAIALVVKLGGTAPSPAEAERVVEQALARG